MWNVIDRKEMIFMDSTFSNAFVCLLPRPFNFAEKLRRNSTAKLARRGGPPRHEDRPYIVSPDARQLHLPIDLPPCFQ